ATIVPRMEILGKRALVTGGAVRVGRTLALALARAGADVVVNYHSSAREAAETVGEIEALGRRALAVRADVSSEADVRRLVGACGDELGGLDILVNSASLFESAPLARITRADWDRVLAVNLTGPFLLSREAAPLLRADGGGVIVNIADLSAFQAWPSYTHHAVSKAGLVHLTRVLARALAPEVRVSCIAPGTVLPPEGYGPDQLARDEGRTALGRIGAPEDVAKALLYLVESDFVTGEVMVVDGGRLLG
ncbi:MAG TPA: SDR family oxidoreductase, partial [Longimicrobiales bacterium]|nr:SDR family oxidoreductase [Longimicrobiales bacterium]